MCGIISGNDNACIESFHSVLKKEEVYTTTYYTFDEALAA